MSTGNDLVFLPATQVERTNLPRFYSRILTAAELHGYQRLAFTGLPFDHYVWLCWSVKESAYKYQKRRYPELLFAPLQFVVEQLDPPGGQENFYTGVVGSLSIAAGAAPLYSRTLIRDGLIMTVVSEDRHFTGTHWGLSSLDPSIDSSNGAPSYADQSAAVRALVLGELRSILSRDDLQLQKDAAGCPILLAGEVPLPIPISLAHHDRYIAYSFKLPPSLGLPLSLRVPVNKVA